LKIRVKRNLIRLVFILSIAPILLFPAAVSAAAPSAGFQGDTLAGVNDFNAGTEFNSIGSSPAPTVNSLEPNTGLRNQVISGILHGTNLTPATTVSFSGTGVTASVDLWDSASQMRITINIGGAAALGSYNVTVTNTVGSNTLVNGFNVLAAAQAARVNLNAPNVVPAGGGFSLAVNVSGADELKVFSLDLLFDHNTIQIIGIDLTQNETSGVSDGLVGGTTVYHQGWVFLPTPGTPSGDVRIIGDALVPASGSGYLAKINMTVSPNAAVGSTVRLTLPPDQFAGQSSGLLLVNQFGDEISPVTSSIAVTIGGAIVTTDAQQAGDIGATTAILRGSLVGVIAGDSPSNLSFGYATKHGGPYTVVSGNPASAIVPTTFTASPPDLSVATTYYYVAQSQSDNGLVMGSESSFTTLDNTGAYVNISVILQGGSRPVAGWAVPLTVKFFTPGTTTPVDVLTATPVYTFSQNTTKNGNTAIAQATGIIQGTYDISAVSPGCLTNVKRGVTIAGTSTDVNLGTLLEGNANNDNKINIQDFGILATSYGKGTGDTGFDARADFDRSGRINIADFGLLAANYARNAPIVIP
jgi:hypothetical protein